MPKPRDTGLDTLLLLAGESYFIGGYRVHFSVTEVLVTPNRPHGLDYSLTLHDLDNKRIVGFDNAHPVKPATWQDAFDHKHVLKHRKPYEYSDAAALIEAFWAEEVDKMLGRSRSTPDMSALKVGILSYEKMKARTTAIARGEYRPTSEDPKVFFTSIESMSQVLSSENQALLAIILEQRPRSLQELAAITGRQKSNLSRTLHTMERYGLVRLEKGHRGSVTPIVMHDRVSVDLEFARSLERAPAV